MQTAISWAQFVIGAIIVTAGYYVVIGYKYYRHDIKNFFSGNGQMGKMVDTRPTQTNDAEYEEKKIPMEGSFDELEELVYELQTAILEKAGQTDKDTLTAMLKKRLENYAGLRKPALRLAVNHFIIQQAEQSCGVIYNEAELNATWQSLLQ